MTKKPTPSGNLRHAGGKTGVALLAALTLAGGAVAGRFENRWGQGVDLAAAGERLDRIPAQFGDWTLEDSQSLSPDVVEMLQCSGSVSRLYRNQKSGAAVTMTLVVGPPGPTSVHTPEVCYSSRDYKTVSAPERFRVKPPGSANAEFWGMTLEATDLRGGNLRVVYAWNAERGWVAPDRPRFRFGGARLLYKLQLAAAADDREPKHADPCRAFLRDALPALDAALFQPAASDSPH